ncbi:MAG TPA: VOC family protein [Tepidisphaeraceae bacterium]|nr:VOC family protein [Tepidisphaeraceae bacterium]
MEVQPYLFFAGRCDEALAFYREALAAEVQMRMRFKDSPHPVPPEHLPPGGDEKVMHVTFTVGGAVVHASDGQCRSSAGFSGFSLSLGCETDAQVDRAFNALLAGGGTVQMPLDKTFFASRFGMVTDKFGVSWMVMNNCAMK